MSSPRGSPSAEYAEGEDFYPVLLAIAGHDLRNQLQAIISAHRGLERHFPEGPEKLYLDLRKHFTCEYDAKQAIGRRYARNDEIGTPFCVTVDHDSLEDNAVTVRERDSMSQERISLEGVRTWLGERLLGC